MCYFMFDVLVQQFLNAYILSACYLNQCKTEKRSDAEASLTDTTWQWHK